MTKRELVEILNDNFKDDDEVGFLYQNENEEGDNEEVFGSAVNCHIHEFSHRTFHWEVIGENGKWMKWKNLTWSGIYESEWKRGMDKKYGYGKWYRRVSDRHLYAVRRLIEIEKTNP